MKRGIRQIRKEMDEALEEYHAKIRVLENEIEELRRKRGTKIKEPEAGDPFLWSGGMRPNGNW